MSWLKKIWKTTFGTSSSEFSGYRILIFTGLFCWLVLSLTNHFTKLPYDNYSKDSKKLDSLLAIMEYDNVMPSQVSQTIKLEKLDPNIASKEKLIGVGFPEWLAKRLIKYRATGARFKRPNDLLKLYGFPDSLYVQIKPYIVIEAKPKISRKAYTKQHELVDERPIVAVRKVLPMFDLNTADTSIFQTIPGIGSKLSNRIVSYRSSLGGFVSVSQLYQIYRLDSVVVGRIIKTSTISSGFIPIKINVNSATKEQFAAHPYIDWSQAKLIIAYRNQHGNFSEIEDLLKVYSIDADWIKNNEPYLSF